MGDRVLIDYVGAWLIDITSLIAGPSGPKHSHSFFLPLPHPPTTETLPTMVTCLGQQHQFIKQFSDIRVLRQASIQIVNQRLVESAVVHAENCRFVVFRINMGTVCTRVVSLQCPCLCSVYYQDYLAITNEGFVAC